jgi:hypothetical protein
MLPQLLLERICFQAPAGKQAFGANDLPSEALGVSAMPAPII